MFNATRSKRLSLVLALLGAVFLQNPARADHFEQKPIYLADRDEGDDEGDRPRYQERGRNEDRGYEDHRQYEDRGDHEDRGRYEGRGRREDRGYNEDRSREYDSRDDRGGYDNAPVNGRYVSNGSCNRSAIGAVLGGVIGGVTGAQVGQGHGRDAATIIGTIVGAVVGASIGRSMDSADRYCTGQALEYSPDRQPVAWHNPDNGSSYVVTPMKTYQRDGLNCRDYTTKVTLDGRSRNYADTSCRQGNNSWQVVDR